MARIEICGGIASGKTTLCEVLSRNQWLAVKEDFRANPFWSLFYSEPAFHAFETETTFLLQHYSQIKVASKMTRDMVCDFSFLQDHAYADINLRNSQLSAFLTVHSEVTAEIGPPALIVHLECTAAEELERIKRRGRHEEKAISLAYLEKLNAVVAQRAHSATATSVVLTVDSSVINFATNSATQDWVCEMIEDSLG